MNHRFLLRLTTNLAVFLLALSCCGIILWITDEILGWDILPDVLSLLVRALLIAGGIITVVLMLMNMVLSLALVAESHASRAALPDYHIAPQFKRRIRNSFGVGILAILLLVGGLQLINQVRAQANLQAARTEFNQAKADMDQSMEAVLGLFTPPMVEAIATDTLAQSGQLGNLTKLFQSIQASFPYQPSTILVTPARQDPYRYAHIERNSITTQEDGSLALVPQFYATFPSEAETQLVDQLFLGEQSALTAPLEGAVFQSDLPSSWGVLTHNEQMVAIVYIESPLPRFNRRWIGDPFHHNGPNQLITN